MKKIPLFCLLVFLSLGLISTVFNDINTSSSDLSPAEKTGKTIYTKGKSTSGVKITANMSGVEVPATLMTCINCHKSDGTGNPEGGITPSDITWAALTRSYGGKRIDGATRPAYTDATLRKVITTGIDPGGNKLHNAMPTYNMTRKDLDDLIAYMKVLGTENDVGLTDTTVHIGIALKGQNALSNGRNEAIKKAIQSYSQEINERGGIYHRKLDVSFLNEEEVISENECFAITGFGQRISKDISNAPPALLHSSDQPTPNGLNDERTFYVYPSLTAQSKALIDYSFSELKATNKNVVIGIETDKSKDIANNVAAYCEETYGKSALVVSIDSGSEVQIAKNKGISNESILIYLGPSTLGDELLNQLDQLNKTPYVLTPGSFSGFNLYTMPKRFQDKVFIAYPTWVTERLAPSMYWFRELQTKYDLPSQWKNSQLEAISMLMTIEECLKRTGRELSQKKLTITLEELYEFSTGLAPSITYDSNQRVGSTSMYIATFDSETNQVKLVNTIKSNEL